MKIINIKFNFKFFILFICSLIVILSMFFMIDLFNSDTIILNNKNYTTTLKKVHDAPENYIDKKVNMEGYVFRANDFKDNQFVVARDMIVSDNDYRIVGFLCESNNIKLYENNVWIEVKGIIKLKDYHGPMPIVEVYEINKITTPNEAIVYPPKNNRASNARPYKLNLYCRGDHWSPIKSKLFLFKYILKESSFYLFCKYTTKCH